MIINGEIMNREQLEAPFLEEEKMGQPLIVNFGKYYPLSRVALVSSKVEVSLSFYQQSHFLCKKSLYRTG